MSVRNSGAVCWVILVAVKVSVGLQSSEGLTGAERSTSKISHPHGCWQEASILHRLFIGGLRSLCSSFPEWLSMVLGSPPESFFIFHKRQPLCAAAWFSQLMSSYRSLGVQSPLLLLYHLCYFWYKLAIFLTMQSVVWFKTLCFCFFFVILLGFIPLDKNHVHKLPQNKPFSICASLRLLGDNIHKCFRSLIVWLNSSPSTTSDFS